MGMGRIVAGGHFPSDVLWSGGLVYFTALALAAPFGFGRERAVAVSFQLQRQLRSRTVYSVLRPVPIAGYGYGALLADQRAYGLKADS